MTRRWFPWKLGRGGKRFLAEFLTITLGVLVALALEQMVANWRERQRVGDVRASMNTEIADFNEIFDLRRRVAPCVTAKLAAVESWLAEPRGEPIRNVGRPPYFFSSRGAWNSDASDQVARHLGAETFRDYGEIYQGMGEFAGLSRDEQAAWVVLAALENDGHPIGPERRARLREAIATARNTHLLLNAVAVQMLSLADKLGIERNGSLASLRVEQSAICRPLDSPPPPAVVGK